MQQFESLLLAPAIILGTPAEAGLNQKNFVTYLRDTI
jgi:hypothetical protein